MKGGRKLCVAHYQAVPAAGELRDFERGLVIRCHISKKFVRDIAALLKLPKSMVGDLFVKWKCEGTTTMKP
jgi:hypothetical protein